MNKKPTVAERCERAFSMGQLEGRAVALSQAKEEFNCSKAAAQRDLMKGAAELAQANAKLTYAMSQMVEKKGW